MINCQEWRGKHEAGGLTETAAGSRVKAVGPGSCEVVCLKLPIVVVSFIPAQRNQHARYGEAIIVNLVVENTNTPPPLLFKRDGYGASSCVQTSQAHFFKSKHLVFSNDVEGKKCRINLLTTLPHCNIIQNSISVCGV